jgi:hypothetical protein
MDKTPLAPVAPLFTHVDTVHEVLPAAALPPLLLALPLALPSAMPLGLGGGGLAGASMIGGEGEVEGPIGLADRTPWLGMAPGLPQPVLRVGEGKPGVGKRDAVLRRARSGRPAPHAGAECSAGVCICGRCPPHRIE